MKRLLTLFALTVLVAGSSYGQTDTTGFGDPSFAYYGVRSGGGGIDYTAGVVWSLAGGAHAFTNGEAGAEHEATEINFAYLTQIDLSSQAKLSFGPILGPGFDWRGEGNTFYINGVMGFLVAIRYGKVGLWGAIKRNNALDNKGEYPTSNTGGAGFYLMI